MNRRQFFQASASAAALLGSGTAGFPQGCPVQPDIVRDRLWFFGVPPNSDFHYFHRRSVMTAAEGAYDFCIPNMIMVQQAPPYSRFDPPLAQYAVALRGFRRVVWSVVGSGGFTSEVETEEVLEIAKRMPNFCGIMLDDFFHGKREGQRAAFTLEQLSALRKRLDSTGRKLDMYVTLYAMFLDLPLRDYLQMMDVITLWGGDEDLSGAVEKTSAAAPGKRKLVGIYIADWGNRKDKPGRSLPIPDLERRCETALRLLVEKRIDGMVILANNCMDLGFESVEWARNWVHRVGGMKL